LHPYYKLKYIKLAWGGAKEQEAEIAASNKFAKNWQDKARKIIENTVSILLHLILLAEKVSCWHIGKCGLEQRWAQLKWLRRLSTQPQMISHLSLIDTVKH
jgi:hypothetical protein